MQLLYRTVDLKLPLLRYDLVRVTKGSKEGCFEVVDGFDSGGAYLLFKFGDRDK